MMNGRKTGNTGEDDSDRKHLTGREVERLIEATKGSRNEARDRCLLLLIFRHGLRVSEACRLKLDQVDTESRVSRDQALEMAQKADVVIYAISTNITREDSEGDKVLRYLTEETGGQAFFPFKIEDLDQSFENIANELRHQYNIFYRPEPLKTDGLFHPVTVKPKRKDLVVRARKGYYAPRL